MDKKQSFGSKWIAQACWALGALTLSCAGAADSEGDFEDEDVETIIEPIWESGCLTATPNATRTGTFDFSTPTNYDHTNPVCFRTFIFQLTNADIRRKGGYQYAGSWNITTGAGSTRWSAFDIYERVGSNWELRMRDNGKEHPGCSGLACQPEIMRVSMDSPALNPGRTYRIMATARTSRSGSTLPMHFWSQFPFTVR